MASKTSEDVIRVFENVRVKKVDGTLYFMTERIAWMPNCKSQFTISHHYSEIKSYKVSSATKAKVQLQIILSDGNDIFQFTNPAGVARQTEDRNAAQKLVAEMTPLFKKKISTEIENKWKLLKNNPKLHQLYKDLVTTRIISSEEFWEKYATRMKITTEEMIEMQKDKVGVSSAFLADIKPQAGGNKVQYNITSEIIQAIFETYPIVKRKHLECVPHKLSEEEFWQRFFQSHYFHRDRISSGKDFFNDCAKQDDYDMENAIKKSITEPFFDLRCFDDQASLSIQNVLEPKELVAKQEYSANQALIRRFNFHSYMVLDACRSEEERYGKGLMGLLSHSKKHKKKAEEDAAEASKANEEFDEALENKRNEAKKRRLEDATLFDDLSGKKPSVGAMQIEFDEGVQPPSLEVSSTEYYKYGPTPQDNSLHHNQPSNLSSSSMSNNVDNNVRPLLQRLDQTIRTWKPLSGTIIEPTKAVAALRDLSPGGYLMKDEYSSLTLNLKDELNSEAVAELRHLTLALDELLYHFWQSQPCVNEVQERKFVDMKETLERFEYQMLDPFHDKIFKNYHRDVTGHLKFKLQVAYDRFRRWEAKTGYHAKKVPMTT